MIDFLIKSSSCLLLFLGFYHWILQNEKMHHFNRFYLLASIVTSLVIPFITFEIIKILPVSSKAIIPITNRPIAFGPIKETIDYTPFILWTIYLSITLVLLIRFGKNIWKLVLKSKSNPTVNYRNSKLILVEEKTLPHTFLNCIYINFEDYNQQHIEDELYTHELVHVTQKHTLDILFIEFLKTIFWFNPIFILYKKAIQLNHEFLADEKVVASSNNVPFYQSLLLQKNNLDKVFLTSNLNYQITKKRFVMMTKETSKTVAILKKIAILPVLMGIIYFFCVEIVAQEKTVSSKPDKNIIAGATTAVEKKKNNDIDNYFKGVQIRYYEKLVATKDGAKFPKIIFDKKYEELTKSEKKEIEISLLLSMQNPLEKKSPTQSELNEFKNAKKFAIWIDGKNVSNNELDKYNPKDFSYYSGSVILKNARTKKHPQPFQYWFYTQPYFEKQNIGKSKDKYPGDEIVIFKDGKNMSIMPTVKSAVKAEVVSVEETKDIAVGKEANLKEPSFPGGISEFYKFIAQNFKMPENFKNKEKLIVSFIIEKDGSLTHINVKKDLGSGTKQEAIRVLKKSPKWIPATVDNKNIRYEYVLPISITADK